MIDTKRDDVFLQLFKLNAGDKYTFPLCVMNEIEVIKIENMHKYFSKYNLVNKDILVVGYKSNEVNSRINNIKVSESLFQNPNAIWIGQLASNLINKFDKINNGGIAFHKVDPIYVRSPEINK